LLPLFCSTSQLLTARNIRAERIGCGRGVAARRNRGEVLSSRIEILSPHRCTCGTQVLRWRHCIELPSLLFNCGSLALLACQAIFFVPLHLVRGLDRTDSDGEDADR